MIGEKCDIRGIEYTNTMERDGFALTPLSEEQKRSESSIECAGALDLVYLPPDSDSIVKLSDLKCEQTPSTPPSWQYHLHYTAHNGSVVEEWRTNKVKTACRRKVCTACGDWSFPCDGATCVKPKPEASADGCPVHVCPDNRIRVNAQAATIGRPFCKRTGEDTFEWYFNGEVVRTATCVKEVNCSTAVPPLQCGAVNCADILTTDSPEFKCKEDRELRLTYYGAETLAEGVYCSDERWMWMNSSRVPFDLQIDAELRCVVQQPSIPASAYVAGLLLPICIALVCIIFLSVVWIHFRMDFKRKIAYYTAKLKPPAAIAVGVPGNHPNGARRKVRRSRGRPLTPEEQAKAMAAAAEKFKNKFPHLAAPLKPKPTQVKAQNKQLSTSEKREKTNNGTTAYETEISGMQRTRDSRDSRTGYRRRRRSDRDSYTSKKNRRYDDDESDSESTRREYDSLDERSARDGVPSERSRKRAKRRRQQPKRRKSVRSKRAKKDKEEGRRKKERKSRGKEVKDVSKKIVDARADKTQKSDRTQKSEVTEKTQVEEEKTAREVEKGL